MNAFADWVASGRIVDVALAVTALEAGLVVAWHRRTGRGIAPWDFFVNLASGVCLMLALRTAMVGGRAGWIALWLAAALVAHLIDLHRRWRR